MYTHELKYYHQNSSKGNQASGHLDINAYKEYTPGQASDGWIILGSNAMYDDFIKGKPIKSGSKIRIYNPKTKSNLQFHLSNQYTSPLPSLLEVTTAPESQISNGWIITIQKNETKNGEIEYGKTLFTIEAQNGQEQKYLSVSSIKFKIVSDIRDFQKQPVVGLDKKTKNYWFIEKLDEAPGKIPEEITTKEIVESKEKIEVEADKKTVEAKKIIPEYPNLMLAANGFGKALSRSENKWNELNNDGLTIKIINKIAVGPQNRLWILDYKNRLYFKKEASKEDTTSSTWKQIDNNIFIDISAGSDGSVLAINNENEVLSRQGITTDIPMGNGWNTIRIQNLQQNEKIRILSVGPTGNIVAVSDQDNIYFKDSTSNETTWVKTTQAGLKKTKQLSLGPNDICWAVDYDNKIRFIKNLNNSSDRWYLIDGILSQIEISQNGSLWGVHPSGLLYKRKGITEAAPSGKAWQNITSNVYQLTFSSENIPFCIFRSHFDLYTKENSSFSKFIGSSILSWQENKWNEVSLNNIPTLDITSLNSSNYGLIFASDPLLNHYQRTGQTPSNPNGTNWIQIDSPMLTSLFLTKDEKGTTLIGNNINNKIIKIRTELALESPLGKAPTPDTSFPKIPIKQLLTGSNNIKMALGQNGIIYYPKENIWNSDQSEKLQQISMHQNTKNGILSTCLWGITNNGKVLFKTDITSANPKGSVWQEVQGKELQQIFISPSGKVYGLSTEEHNKFKGNFWLYIRDGISNEKSMGTEWKSMQNAIATLPNIPTEILKYGDTISICNTYDEKKPEILGGFFIDTQNNTLILNTINGKKHQQIKIINPANTKDKSIITKDSQIILQTSDEKYLTTIKIGENFFFKKSNINKAITFNFNNNLETGIITYEQKLDIKANNKYLTYLHGQAIQSNLTLGQQSKSSFFIMKPIQTDITEEQKSIDQIDTPVSSLIKQLNKALLTEENKQKAFGEVMKILGKNKNQLDSKNLEELMQIAISLNNKDLLSKEDRNYIMQNIIPNIIENNTEIKPLLKKILSKFKDALKNITKPDIAIFKFIELFYLNRTTMNQEEQESLKELISNLQNTALLENTLKSKLPDMINTLSVKIPETKEIKESENQALNKTQPVIAE